MARRAAWIGWLVSAAVAATLLSESSRTEETPPGVEQLMPRGRLAAIVEPRYVAAEEAEIPDGAWVLGVSLDGEARAYDLNLLNAHEVVNDRIGDTAYAAVW